MELCPFIHNRDHDEQLGADSSAIARIKLINTRVVSDIYSIFGIIKMFPNMCF